MEERNIDLLHNAFNDTFQGNIDQSQYPLNQEEQCASAILAQYLQTNVAEFRVLTELRQQVNEHSTSTHSALERCR